MSNQQHISHDEERHQIHQKYKFFYQILGGSVLVLIGFLIGYVLFSGDDPLINDSYLTNAFTEALSIGITVILIGKWQEHRRIEQLKKDLVRNAGKSTNSVAKDAVDDLRHYGWLTGENGLLKGTKLWDANLEGAKLGQANLKDAELVNANLGGAKLWVSNLKGAKLTGANLKGADLVNANLGGAELWVSNLKRAKLTGANLKGATLMGANLEGVTLMGANLGGATLTDANLKGAKLGQANLKGANLTGANLQDTTLYTSTTLPDGTKWTPDTDMTRFTDPDHPDYFQPQ